MRFCTMFAVIALSATVAGPCNAYERDVHFGLTKWLALQAGFPDGQADAIAIGDQRVDAGDIQFMELLSVYACTGKDAESSRNVRYHSFPTAGAVPGKPETRAVVAGDAAASAATDIALKVDKDKAGFTLYRLGESLHALQDSWAHQGVPDIPSMAGKPCDETLAWGHPAKRGGWNSHHADITSAFPQDALEMAAASYRVLTRYPSVGGVARKPVPWEQLRPMLDGFMSARTKAEKARWFTDRGFTDLSFLAGTTLPDGSTPFRLEWRGDRLPPIKTMRSDQHHIDPEVLEFLSNFFGDWMSTDDLGAMANRYAPEAAAKGARGKGDTAKVDVTKADTLPAAQLAARLKLWRMRDHGVAAELAHSVAAFGAAQLGKVAALTRSPEAFMHYESPTAAFTPILPKTPESTPIVPFLIVALPASGANPRMLATARFRHAPYDTVQVLIEKSAGRWGVVSILPVVEH